MRTVVVGAGLSGLIAARRRLSAGDEVLVLEARDRVGGRLWTVRGRLAQGQFAELGAETLYAGQDHVMRLAAEFGLSLVSCGFFDPATPPIIVAGHRLDEDRARGLVDELDQARTAYPSSPFENQEAWANRAGISPLARRYLTSYAQYTPVTSLRHADAGEFLRQFQVGKADSYRIVGGNDLLATRLAEDLDVRFGEHVKVIDWSGPQVRVETQRGSTVADRVIVTVPGPVTAEIGFAPALPSDKLAALTELTYGTASKVVVQYHDDGGLAEAIGAGWFTDGVPPWIVDQAVHQDGDAVCLSTLLGGDAEPAGIDEQILQRFDDATVALTGSRPPRAGHLVHSWTRDPFTRVVVRAPLGDQRSRVLPLVKRPLDSKVFFAGEHTDDRVGPGGLEGAARSGLRVAAELD